MTYPIFISFYCGSQYYYDAAKNLMEDCEKLGIPYDIEELKVDGDLDWAAICRKKIQFYARKLEEHKQPVFWLDVDTRVLKRPKIFENAEFDFAAFLRNFSYFREYDPVLFARTFHPGFLYFNYTDAARTFVYKVASLEQSTTNVATDDFFLQEAWMTSKAQMDITLLPPKRVRRMERGRADDGDAWFSFGESGSVKVFIDKVDQHEASIFDRQRQARVLKTLAGQDLAKGDLGSAAFLLAKTAEVDPADDEPVHTLVRVLRRQKQIAEALDIYAKRLGAIAKTDGKASSRYGDFLLIYFDFAVDNGELKIAEGLVNELLASPNDKHRNVGRSRAFLLSLENRAQGIDPASRTRLWWMEQPYPGNFGDIVNPYIVEKLSGIPPQLTKPGEGVLAVGSVIKFAKTGTIVWGSGSPRLTDKLAADADYRAVRGPLTRRLVLDSGGTCRPVYGDPALLLPFIYRPKTRKKHALGLIRHFTHKGERLDVDPSVKEIDIFRVGYQEIEEFLDELWECEAVVSTSLHGIIVAHAYGIPVTWATFADVEKAIPGGDVKFADYFASVGLYDQEPLDLGKVAVLDSTTVKGRATTIQSDPDYEKLLAVAPMRVALTIASLDRAATVSRFER